MLLYWCSGAPALVKGYTCTCTHSTAYKCSSDLGFDMSPRHGSLDPHNCMVGRGLTELHPWLIFLTYVFCMSKIYFFYLNQYLKFDVFSESVQVNVTRDFYII